MKKYCKLLLFMEKKIHTRRIVRGSYSSCVGRLTYLRKATQRWDLKGIWYPL